MMILLRTTTLLLLMGSAFVSIAQDKFQEIRAENLNNLVPVAQIDFSELDGEFEVGWFAANDDASEFIIFDRDINVYRVSDQGEYRQVPLVERSPEQVLAVLDALFKKGEPTVLYLLDQHVYVNQHLLGEADEYIALFWDSERDEIIVEATAADGVSYFLRYALSTDGETLTYVGRMALPSPDDEGFTVRVGRVAFPNLIISLLDDSGLNVYKYTDAVDPPTGANYMLDGGPAVFGALNGEDASHFAWNDPRSDKLNLLDLASGQNRVVADLKGAYAQYMFLTRDASVIIVVNLDFAPHVYAWDIDSGQQFDLGRYRECARIPDMVRLSADGASLIIGCDRGLDIWRIAEEREFDP